MVISQQIDEWNCRLPQKKLAGDRVGKNLLWEGIRVRASPFPQTEFNRFVSNIPRQSSRDTIMITSILDETRWYETQQTFGVSNFCYTKLILYLTDNFA